MPADSWAKRKTGSASAATGLPSASGDPTTSASSNSGGVLSISAASSESFEDEEGKFHLPVDHQPFMLLPGWDKKPAPPPAPVPPPAAGSPPGGSASSASGGAPPQVVQAPPPPPPPGFACADCVMFRAHGNGGFGCESKDFQRWAGTDRLVETKSGRPVLDPTRSCSDWFVAATGSSAKKVPTRHSK